MTLLNREEIDDDRWNHCVQNASNAIIYGLTWYLDAITSKSWLGLVWGDYEAVMPVYAKKWMFIPYYTTPLLCQQQGIFRKYSEANHIPVDDFYQQLRKFPVMKYDILTKENIPDDSKTKIRINHILNIDKPYDEIAADFHRNTRRNLKKATDAKLIFRHVGESTQGMIFLAKHDPTTIIRQHFGQISTFTTQLLSINKGIFVEAVEGDATRAVGYFVEEGGRLYFLLCASDQRGREVSSTYFLIDEMIKRYAGRCRIFDFTGSNIDNIARRNEGFGAEKEVYFHIYWSRLG